MDQRQEKLETRFSDDTTAIHQCGPNFMQNFNTTEYRTV